MFRSRLVVLAVAVCFAWPATSIASVDVPVSVFGTFLRVDPTDTAAHTTRIRLADHGIAPGALLLLQAIGDFDNGPGGDEFVTQIAIFSSDSVLLDPTLLTRVSGALDCGRRGGTGPTCPSGLPTNIVEDFYVRGDSTMAIVPPGAAYLFVMPAECYFMDNSDPDADYAIRITTVGTTGVGVGAPRALGLSTPWPNPSSRSARLSFRLPAPSRASVQVFGIDGARVRTLHEGRVEAGEHPLTWDLRDEAGTRVEPGIYFVRLEAGGQALRHRLVVVR